MKTSTIVTPIQCPRCGCKEASVEEEDDKLLWFSVGKVYTVQCNGCSLGEATSCRSVTNAVRQLTANYCDYLDEKKMTTINVKVTK